jgi:hypothetical protein
MPSDDLVLNVRQISGYPGAGVAPPDSALLLQIGGLGGAYQSIAPATLVATALAQGGSMAIAGPLAVQEVSGGSLQFSNAAITMLSSQKACIVDFAATFGTLGGVPIATQTFVEQLVTNLQNTVVWAFNGRRGDVRLWIDDIICAGGAPLFSPRFEGEPRAYTPDPTSNSSRLATTAFVTNAVGTAFASYAPLESPEFSGVPTAPTAAVGTTTGQLATTAFVMTAVAASTTGVVSFNGRSGLVTLQGSDVSALGFALLVSPAFVGTPSAPTATVGNSTTQIATTAFVMAAVAAATAGVATFNGRTGNVVLTDVDVGAVGVSSFNNRIGPVTLQANDISAAGGAVLASPIFTGVPTAPTAAPGVSTAQLATCAFVMAAVSASVASFNGRTGAVTLSTADVTGVLPAATANPLVNGTAAPGSSTAWSRGDHVHPVDTSRAAQASLANYLLLSGGTMTGNLNALGVAASNVNCSGNLTVGGATQLDGACNFALSAVTDFAIGAVAPNRQIQFTVGSVVNVNSSTGTFSWTWSNTNMFTCGPDATFTVGTLVQTSDGDGKADIVDYVGGLADLLQLRPRSFKRLSPVTRAPVASELGFVHQEARPVREEFGPISAETKGISPTAILACAVAAIQDLSAKLDALMGRIDQLEAVR